MKFSDSHEWIHVEEGTSAIVGITEHAQKELGDIVYVELPEVGKKVKLGQEVVVLESTKAAADVYSPVSGTITEVNQNLKTSPDKVNHSPEKEGWLFKINLDQPEQLDLLMDRQAYEKMILRK